MVDFGEAQVFEGEMAKTSYGFVRGNSPGLNLGKEIVESFRVHIKGRLVNCRRRRRYGRGKNSSGNRAFLSLLRSLVHLPVLTHGSRHGLHSFAASRSGTNAEKFFVGIGSPGSDVLEVGFTSAICPLTSAIEGCSGSQGVQKARTINYLQRLLQRFYALRIDCCGASSDL